jgi:hypothetical protein
MLPSARVPSTVLIESVPEPSLADLDSIVGQLKDAWTAKITVRRQSKDDLGIRDIYVSIDDQRVAVLAAGDEVSKEVVPGPHRVRVHNTLFRRTLDLTVAVGEHVSFMAANRRGFGTYSILSLLLGSDIVYLTLEREASYRSRNS